MHLAFTCSKTNKKTVKEKTTKQTKKQQHHNSASNIFKVNIEDTRTMSDAFIVNFEHISHIIILSLLLNSNKQMPVGPEKLFFQIISLFSVTVGYIMFYGLRKFNCWATWFHPHLPNILFCS